MNDAEAKVDRHRRRRLPPRRGRAAEGERGRRRSRARRRCKHVVVVRRTGERRSPCRPGRDHWWHELHGRPPPTCARRSRSTPSTRSSSSTRAAPPGSRRASCTPPAATCCRPRSPRKYVFDLKDEDTYWCTADIGWVTGHSYVVYGPLANGATTLHVRGRAQPPGARPLLAASSSGTSVTIFYTAPTAIRAFMRWGEQWPQKHDLVSAAPAGHGGGADQPRGLDVVPHGDRRRALPDRRHLVADGDGRDHDHARCPAPRPTKPGSGTLPFFGVDARRWWTRTATRCRRAPAATS